MTVTLPTVDDFTETTVLTMIRKVVDYLCSDSGLVAQINNNDITGFTSSYTNNVLKIDATKGDGTTIPVCNLTIEDGSSTGNPYPTGISGTVGADGNITFTVTMSSGSPLTTTINMNYFASTQDLSDLQEQVTGLKLTSSGNNMSINGTSAPIVNSISGIVSNGNLKITVNGVESGDIPLPDSVKIYVQNPYHFNNNIKTFSHRNEYCIECYKKSDMEGNFYSVGNIITSVELSSQYYYENPIEHDLYWASINDTDTVNIFKHIIPDYASLEDGEYRISMYAMLPDNNMLYAMAGYGDVRLIKSGESITSGAGSSYIFTELETITTDAIVIITAMDKVS